jgi:hypothetical protein
MGVLQRLNNLYRVLGLVAVDRLVAYAVIEGTYLASPGRAARMWAASPSVIDLSGVEWGRPVSFLQREHISPAR